MDERELSLFNLYLHELDKKGVIWEFYNVFRATADEDCLSDVSNNELEVRLNKSTKTIIKLKKQLKDLGLLEEVEAKMGHRNIVRFPPVAQSVFGKYLNSYVHPKIVREEILTKKTLFSHTVTHRPVDEYDYSPQELHQPLEKQPLISSVPHNNNNKTELNKVNVMLCGTLEKHPSFSSGQSQEEQMKDDLKQYNWETRQKAFKVFDSWNTTLKEYAHREGTGIPKGLKFEAATLSPTSLAAEVCNWIEEQGEDWEELWNTVIEKLKVNQFLQFGHEGFVPTLAWMFKHSEKGKGIERVLDGLYDFKDKQIATVNNERDAVRVAEQLASKFKGKSKTYVMD